jgi:hypothetical protein
MKNKFRFLALKLVFLLVLSVTTFGQMEEPLDATGPIGPKSVDIACYMACRILLGPNTCYAICQTN